MPSSNAAKLLQPRRTPSQRRSQERLDTILNVSTELIALQGSGTLSMSEIAEKSGISIGSLYQYFPNKAALIATLAQQYQQQGHHCVQVTLAPVSSEADLLSAMQEIVNSYYAMYQDNPALRDLWGATQADSALRAMDDEDVQTHANMLLNKLEELRPAHPGAERATTALLCMHLLNAAVRLAVTLEPTEARFTLNEFKEKVLAALLSSQAQAIKK